MRKHKCYKKICDNFKIELLMGFDRLITNNRNRLGINFWLIMTLSCCISTNAGTHLENLFYWRSNSELNKVHNYFNRSFIELIMGFIKLIIISTGILLFICYYSLFHMNGCLLSVLLVTGIFLFSNLLYFPS